MPAVAVSRCVAYSSVVGIISPIRLYTERIVRLIPRLVRAGGYVMIQIRRDTPNAYAHHSEHGPRSYAERAIYATVWGGRRVRRRA